MTQRRPPTSSTATAADRGSPDFRPRTVRMTFGPIGSPRRNRPRRRGSKVRTTHGGRTRTGIGLLEWVAQGQLRGAGEILLNSMDADGTKDGFDLELIRLVRAEVTVPVIASGGAGAAAHFAPAVRAGADAVLAASVFHFGELTIGQVKDALRADGHPVR